MNANLPEVGNLYGLDIKLTQKDQKVVPVLIELNGVDSGTDSFRYEEGFHYYDRFVRVLGAQAKGKPIMIEGWTKKAHDQLENAVRKAELERNHEAALKGCAGLASIVGGHFEFEYSWLNDLLAFNIAKLDEKFDDTESRFYALAAKKLGIPLFVYKELSYGENHIEFELIDGRRLQLRPEQIGMIRSRSSTLYTAPSDYRNLFLNDPLLERIMENKPYAYFLATVFSDDLKDAFPLSMPFGFGVNDTAKLLQFLESVQSDLVVRKRGSSYCGTGVEILERQKLIESIKEKSAQPISPAKMQALVHYVLRNIVNGWMFEHYLSNYEQFVPSIPILNPKTGKYHDGCARVMVYSPPEGKPIVLGSQWRIATHNMQDTSGTLEDRFRVNLSRGATAMRISPEHEEIMHEFAAPVIDKFEYALEVFRHLTKKEIDEMKTVNPNANELDAFRMTFWSFYLKDKLKSIGAMPSDGEINNLPGLEEELKKLPVLAAEKRIISPG